MYIENTSKNTRYETKAFFYSLLIHTTLLGSYFIYTYNNPIIVKSKSDVISMSLASFELPPAQSVVEPVKPVEEVKKVEPKKVEPVKEIEPLKPIIPIEKPKPKPIEKPVEKKVIKPIQQQTSQSESQKVVEKVLDKRGLEQNFVKTNFGIIREKVFSKLVYPRMAQRMRWTGVTEVAIVVDVTGKLLEAYVVKSSGRKPLDKAALRAALALEGDTLPKPQVQSTVILPIAFNFKTS